MLTLAAVKSEMGINPVDSANDADLQNMIRQVVARIRQRTDRGIAWVTDSIKQNDSVTVIRVIGHGWRTGQVISIQGSNSTPSVDGERTVTRIDEDRISIPGVTVTIDGTYATLHPIITKELTAISSVRVWVPEQITPFLSVEAIYDRLSDDSWLIVDSNDYVVADEPTTSKAVLIERIEGSWQQAIKFPRGQYALRTRSRTSTVKLSVLGGTTIVPADLVMAGLSLVNDLWERAGRGKDEASFSYQGANRSSMTGDERREHLLSPDAIISSWTAR